MSSRLENNYHEFHEHIKRNQKKTLTGFKITIATTVIMLMLVAGFWATMFYIAWHFISKYW